MPDTQPIEITVTLCWLRNEMSRTRTNYYECHGPDGTRFTNSSRATLLDVLRRKYGRGVKLTVIDNR